MTDTYCTESGVKIDPPKEKPEDDLTVAWLHGFHSRDNEVADLKRQIDAIERLAAKKDELIGSLAHSVNAFLDDKHYGLGLTGMIGTYLKPIQTALAAIRAHQEWK